MLEMLLSAGARKIAGNYPDSGPGTKQLLFGDTTGGYFGEVSESELYNNLGIWALSQITAGTLYSGSITWLKFFIDGKVVYYAKNQVAVNMSWTDIYNAGCALGVRGIGPYPVGAGVDQLRLGYVKEGAKEWALILRLPKTGLTDPALVDATNVLQSEWNRTILRLISGGGWGTLTPADLARGTETVSVMAETWTNSTTYVYTRGSANNLNTRTNIPKTQITYWRPVLELVDATKFAFDPRNVVYSTDGLEAPSMLQVTTPASEQLQNLTAFNWNNTLNAQPSITDVTLLDVANPPTGISYSGTSLNQFGVVIDDVDVIPTQTYIWEAGPLSEFGFTTETI